VRPPKADQGLPNIGQLRPGFDYVMLSLSKHCGMGRSEGLLRSNFVCLNLERIHKLYR